MNDDLAKDLAPRIGEPIDPVAMARRDLQKSLPKRFYNEARAEARDEAFVLLLDGRVAKTPARNLLALPTLAAAEAVAAEWAAQDDLIDPAMMPLTRIVNSAIDGVALNRAATAAEIVKFAGSDLICYRAGEPEALARAQAAAWDPVLDFAREKLRARFICAEGVIFVEQPAQALAAFAEAIERFSRRGPAAPFILASLHVMTTLTGSALIALAVAYGALTAGEAWTAAHVDEEFQIGIWGADEEAMLRRARRWTEMAAAANLLRLVA